MLIYTLSYLNHKSARCFMNGVVRLSGRPTAQRGPVEKWHYDAVNLADLPQVGWLERPPCMTESAEGRALLLPPRIEHRRCCWYHSIDWHIVNELAIRSIRGAQAAGVAVENVRDYAAEVAAVARLSQLDACALMLLLGLGAGIYLNDEDPNNVTIGDGRHRITAMRDAGVLRTVITRLEAVQT
jgi:hypothetical protein